MDTADASRLEADVVVVGAGLAGLVAARELTRAGLAVVVLEARERVGGRLHGLDVGDGRTVDMGGEFFGALSTKIEATARSVGVEGFASHFDGRHSIFIGGRVRRYTGFFPRSDPLTRLIMAAGVRRLEQLTRRVPPERPWDAPRARALDRMTFRSWADRQPMTPRARELLETMVESVYCASSADISLLHALQYASTSGGFRYTIANQGGVQESRFATGAHSIPKRLAEGLQGSIALGAAVRRIEQGRGRVRVICEDGRVAEGARAVVAVPPTLAGRIAYEPRMTGFRDQLTQRMPAGAAIKCVAVYDEPFWRAHGFSGHGGSAPPAAIRCMFDTSPPDGRPGILAAFVTGSAARRLNRMDAAERRRIVQDELVRFFGPRAARPVRWLEKDWLDDPWARGCYHGFCPPNTWTAYGPALREPAGRIHWAGSETGTHAMGSMGGAVESGERAAREVLAAGIGGAVGQLARDSLEPTVAAG